ncbi:MAG: endolytic transglycosylase MltG [Clostridium sp.]|uniref:endolytic transglycosylase MltG n=1 Tax=Clostridium sp. TaxID=1506 RepID=UPI003EE58449
MEYLKKHLKKIIIGIIIVVVLIIAAIGGYAYSVIRRPFTSNGNVNITIKGGEGFYNVLDDLRNAGLMKNETVVKAYVKVMGITPKITPGEYTIKNDVTLDQFINILNTQDTIKVVIPEGYTVDQIANTFQELGLFSTQQFISALEKYPLPAYVKNVKGRRYTLEGYLFPDTYEFNRGETPDNVIKTMLNTFQLSLEKAEKATGVTLKENQIDSVVTKASVIQGEAKTFKDMRNVSSVIDNRIKANMPLQMDATVIYAMGKHVNKVYYKDLKIDSPYNTYKYKGLPIGPICNPGIEALEAAMNPAKTDYLYYILNGPNEHFFTNSYQAFEKQKEIYNKENN